MTDTPIHDNVTAADPDAAGNVQPEFSLAAEVPFDYEAEAAADDKDAGSPLATIDDDGYHVVWYDGDNGPYAANFDTQKLADSYAATVPNAVAYPGKV